MDHDNKMCPLCRTPFISEDLQESFNERLWAASSIRDFYDDYSSPITALGKNVFSHLFGVITRNKLSIYSPKQQ
ncbi:hypothetical protein LguiB_031097 [Lonicera macranthoides]